MIGPVTLDWYAADLRTGAVLEELRSFSPSGTIGRRLGVSVTSNGVVATGEGVSPGWIDATTPGRSMVVAVDSLAQVPVWAGFVLTRERGSAITVPLGLVTPEAYFDRRYTGDYNTAVSTDQAVILTGTGTALAVDAPCFTFDAPASGLTLASYSVADGDDRSILSVWQELMSAEAGVEWTVDVAWNVVGASFVLPIRVRPQVGVQSTTPEVVFDYPGNVTSYTQTESYEAGKGATTVVATGNGQGATRLRSDVYQADDLIAAGWPEWVYRFTPAAGLDDPVQLNSHAAAALAQMRDGSSVWAVSAAASRTPHVGVDWGIGDTMGLLINSSPGHPDGAEVVVRNYGWDLDAGADSITPILIEGS